MFSVALLESNDFDGRIRAAQANGEAEHLSCVFVF